jgi:hypothetical protein
MRVRADKVLVTRPSLGNLSFFYRNNDRGFREPVAHRLTVGLGK